MELGAVLTTGFGAPYGRDQRAALEMAVRELNRAGGVGGRQIRLSVASRTPETTAEDALRTVLEREPVAIVGPVFGLEVLALQSIVDREGVPLITISHLREVTQLGSSNIFRTGPHDGLLKTVLIDSVLRHLRPERIGLLVSADTWGSTGLATMSARLRETHDIEPVGVETHEVATPSIRDGLTRLRDAGTDTVVIQSNTADIARILADAHDLGVPYRLAGSTDAQQAVELPTTPPEHLRGLFTVGLVMPSRPFPPNLRVAEWARRYMNETGLGPSIYALLQWEGAQVLFEAMERSGVDRASIRDGLRDMRYAGFNGTFETDFEGTMLRTAQVYDFDSGNGSWIDRIG
jgi:branched-chain amino acid transport system substrate-binding protein